MSRQGIGERLRRAREAAALSQDDAAARIGKAMGRESLSRVTISLFEAGKRPLRADEVEMFAKAYGTSVHALMGIDAPRAKTAPTAPKRRSRAQAADVDSRPARVAIPNPAPDGADAVISAMSRRALARGADEHLDLDSE